MKRFRPTLAIVEIFIGSILIAVSIYALWVNRGCSSDGQDCAALGVISTIYFASNGLVFVTAGVGSYFLRRTSLLVFQIPLLATLIALHLWLF